MLERGVDWSSLVKMYKAHGIKSVVHCPINDSVEKNYHFKIFEAA